ncbi:MAG: DUF368 domain-containing protein [Vibrionaceae bacterium]
MKQNILTVLKGMAMGAADVVPGVSGGTIAFITGIYDTLLESIRRINPSLFSLFKQHGGRHVWQHINGSFLVCLITGILTSILLFAKAVSFALAEYPVIIWSFFFGLIVASAIHMIKQIDTWKWPQVSVAILGCVLAYVVTIASPITLEFNLFTVFLAGSIAICAMILPGISGSFILLLLGMYSPVIDAVKGFDFSILGIFAIGCVVGLLSFSHVLSWLLREYRSLTIAFLTGLLVGALGKVWPWREAITFRTNSAGEQVPLLEKVLSPQSFEMVTGQSSQLLLAIVMMVVGFMLVMGMEQLSKKMK